jgi:hypothetical protein
LNIPATISGALVAGIIFLAYLSTISTNAVITTLLVIIMLIMAGLLIVYIGVKIERERKPPWLKMFISAF